jgi:hypothetical protein
MYYFSGEKIILTIIISELVSTSVPRDQSSKLCKSENSSFEGLVSKNHFITDALKCNLLVRLTQG